MSVTHRASIVGLLVGLVALLTGGGELRAAQTEEAEPARQAEEADREEPSDEEGESSRGVTVNLQAPADPTLEVGLGGHMWLWDAAYGGNEREWVPRATLRWFPVRLLALSASVDWGVRNTKAGPLQVVNHHASGIAGVGIVGWLGGVRLGLEAQGGMLLRTSRLSDDSGTTRRNALIRPTVGFEAHAGLTFGGQGSISLAGGSRFYAPRRSDIFFGLRLDWTFGSGRQ